MGALSGARRWANDWGGLGMPRYTKSFTTTRSLTPQGSPSSGTSVKTPSTPSRRM